MLVGVPVQAGRGAVGALDEFGAGLGVAGDAVRIAARQQAPELAAHDDVAGSPSWTASPSPCPATSSSPSSAPPEPASPPCSRP